MGERAGAQPEKKQFLLLKQNYNKVKSFYRNPKFGWGHCLLFSSWLYALGSRRIYNLHWFACMLFAKQYCHYCVTFTTMFVDFCCLQNNITIVMTKKNRVFLLTYLVFVLVYSLNSSLKMFVSILYLFLNVLVILIAT